MTDTPPPTDPDDADLPDRVAGIADTTTFQKEIVKKLGERGTGLMEHVQKETDVDDMSEREVVTTVSFCTCGIPYTAVEDVRKCVGCDGLCCVDCQIRRNSASYCRRCAEEKYRLSKDVYLALYLLEQGRLAIDDLVETAPAQVDPGQAAPAADEDVQVMVDATALPLLEQNYIRTDGTPLAPAPSPDEGGGGGLTVDAEDRLTTAGREALAVGDDLYSDDPEITDLKDELLIQDVATAHQSPQ